jgi:hypothetical protein
MKVKLTKKGKTVFFVILGIIVLGSGGYLLWRVLQPETIAPDDSEAGGGCGPCCSPSFGCVSGWKCVEKPCITSVNCTNIIGRPDRSKCGSSANNGTCNTTCQYVEDKGGYYCVGDYKCVEEEGPPTEGDCKDVKCEWPTVVMSQLNCACKHCDEVSGVCSGNPDKCSPPSCPAGYVSCGVSGSHEDSADCKKNTTKLCWGNHEDCNNPFVVYRYCKPESTETNICEGSSWIEKPSGTYNSCEGITATVDATDPDGISTTSISMKVNGQTKTGFTTGSTTSGTSITYEFSSTDCAEPGEYTISFDWKDSGGNSGDDCTLSTTFTIVEENEPYCGDGIKQSNEVCDPTAEGADAQCTNNIGETVACADNCTCPTADECGDGILSDSEQCELGDPTGYTCTWDSCSHETCLCDEQENPDWAIVKTAAEQCIEEGEQTYAKATYTITITNIGEGEGSIDKVVDNLDEKVLETYINSISAEGAYASGLITWDLTGEDEMFSPDESMQFTYYIKIPSSAYGTYQNTVTAYPTEGENFSDDADVNLTCDIPQTGIFDSVLSKILAGIVLILIGANWGSISKLNYTIKGIASNKRIKNFERKVVKDK